jgi:hypothetical protein
MLGRGESQKIPAATSSTAGLTPNAYIVATKKVLDKKFYTGVQVLHFSMANLYINPCLLAFSLVSVYLLITAQVWTSTGWKSFARNFGNGGAGPLTSP